MAVLDFPVQDRLGPQEDSLGPFGEKPDPVFFVDKGDVRRERIEDPQQLFQLEHSFGRGNKARMKCPTKTENSRKLDLGQIPRRKF
jgi:hypothetical protein